MGVGALNGYRRAVFLDRDGVLNRAVVRDGKPYPPSAPDDLEILPGVRECLDRLHEAGFLLLVVTNQPDVRRGTQSFEAVESMHRLLRAELPIDDFFVCYHDDADDCPCRKPRPGLLLEAARKYGVLLDRSYLVGDRWRDIDAGAAAGCKTILIDYAYNERRPSAPPSLCAASLAEAVNYVLHLSESEEGV
jgi:D-glycero-D-manno-heptose 1,7-bisphosphate phosphatase